MPHPDPDFPPKPNPCRANQPSTQAATETAALREQQQSSQECSSAAVRRTAVQQCGTTTPPQHHKPHLLERMKRGVTISMYLKSVALAVASVGLLHAAYRFNLHGGFPPSLSRLLCVVWWLRAHSTQTGSTRGHRESIRGKAEGPPQFLCPLGTCLVYGGVYMVYPISTACLSMQHNKKIMSRSYGLVPGGMYLSHPIDQYTGQAGLGVGSRPESV